jgi:uncharacterized protein
MIENNHALEAEFAREQSILRNVYIWMALGLALTGMVALGVASNKAIVRALVSNQILFWGLLIVEVGLVWFLSARLKKMSPGLATIGFAGYAALNGVTLSLIFLVYTGSSVATTFFVTAGAFAGLSLYALTTKRSLAGLGTYLVMGVWGIVIASLANMFLRNSAFDLVISIIGVLVFTGLTAYDTQAIRRMSAEAGQVDEADYIRLSILGALKLYLDFINLFLFLLRFLGVRGRND